MFVMSLTIGKVLRSKTNPNRTTILSLVVRRKSYTNDDSNNMNRKQVFGQHYNAANK